MAAAPAAAAPKQNAAVVNANLRTAFLQSAVRQRKNLGVSIGTLGQTTRQKLINVGVTTGCSILVTCPITIGVATAVPSLKGPWNLLNRVRVTDYDGIDRINLSGFMLYIIDSVRARQPYGWNNQQAAQAGAGIVTNPSVPTAVGNGTISFYLDVPIALDDNKWHGLRQDLTGAIYSQTGVGDFYLSIDWNTTLYANGNIEAVYSGAGTTTIVLNGVTGPSVQIWQRYFMPQALGKAGQYPLPMADFYTVYELNGGIRSSDNIAVNAEKLITVPNVRKVLGIYIAFVNNGTLNTTDLNLIRLIVNGNNILEEWSQLALQIEQRLVTEGDVSAGVYFWTYRDKPIYTAIFGNVQMGFTPNLAASNPYFEELFESLYVKGTALPGMVQASA